MVKNDDVILKRFEHPDEVRNFEKGKFELVHVGGMTIGKASYELAGSGHCTSARRKG